MGVGESLGNAYRAVEDKYYSFIDWLDEKGLSLYPIIDRIEENKIPSFPIAVLIVLLIVAGIAFLAMPFLIQQASINFTVSDMETGIFLEGAAVKVTTAAGQEITGLTDADGKATLVVPIGQATAEIEKSGYETFTDSVLAEGVLEITAELEKGVQMLSKTIQLMKTGTNQLMEEEATIRFTCSNSEASDFEEVETSVNGEIDLEVPDNCGNLVATPVAGFTTPDGILSLQDTSPQLFLEAVETNTGTVEVYIENQAGQALAGITVMVYSHDGLPAGTQYSSPAGTAVFDNVATGTYYVVLHDSQGPYADYDSSMLGDQGLKQLVKDGTVSFDVQLAEATVGTINLILKDSITQQPVENAKVYLKKAGTVMDEEYSDSQGVVEFNVGENVPYEVEVDAPAYLLAVEKDITASESFYQIYLEPATADNTQVLKVEVLDNRQKPIDNVRLVLKKSDGTIYANNVVTGADGIGEFTNLPLATYYVYAVKKGFEGKNSDPITIKSRQENKITVVLPIGFGNLEVVVLNDELQPVQGAVIEAINAVSNGKEQEEITNLEGKAIFNFRADKKTFFKVDASNFLPYYSIAIMPDSGSTVTTEIVLAKDPGELKAELLGLYVDGEESPKELAPGAKYTAKLLLLIPNNKQFGEGGLHLRVGNADEGKTNIMEEDSIYLKDVFASTANTLKGTSFSPPKGYAIDSTHLTTGDSKWVNVTWKNVSEGAYAAEAEVQVSEAASLGQILYVSYRGWGKAGSYARFPNDAALGGAESTSAKQALYAKTNERAFTAGPSNLCGANFCKTFGIEDTARNLRVNVTNQYGATIGGMYRLNFLISSTAEQAFTNSEIEFGSKGDGLRFGSYAITDATGLRSEGTVEGYMFAKEIGDMRKESSVFGYIEFKTEKEGSNILTLVIKSNNQPILSESIDIRVEAAEQLQLDVIPKEIIPGIDNQVLVRVSDEAGEAVSNAIVTVTLDETQIIATESNGSGEVEFKLEMPATGSKLVIKAEKIGYKKAEREMLIDSEILTVTPPEISERLDIARNETEDRLWFSNQTVTDFVVSKLRFSKSFQDLVEFEWDDDYIGEEIKADSDINVYLMIRLTEKGMLVNKPLKLEGNLAISLLSPELQQTFVENVPIEIRISLGGDVDESKCLEIIPVKWEVITASDKAQTEEFTIRNHCKIENSPIPLSGLEAKVILGKDNSLGRFTIRSDELPGAKTISLSEDFLTLAEELPADFEGKITIEFRPDSSIDSGTAKPKIGFRASHAAARGEEKISLDLPVEVHVSNLSKCIEVIAEEPIIVETVPLNFGYGQYNQGYNPYYAGGNGGYGGYSGYGGYGNITGGGYGSTPGGGGYLGGSTYPYPNFGSPNYTNYYDTSYDNAWRFGLGENNFLVKNNCASAIEIDLDVPSRLRVKEDNFELQPNTDQTVTVESGYRMGKYDLDVLAKRKGSTDKAQKIETIDVIVRRQGEIDEECIELSTDTISFNDFIGRPVKHEIYNYCYDIGVKLPTAGNVIQFNCQVAGQPMNTYRFEEERADTISLQATRTVPFDPYLGSTNPYGYNNITQQPSSYINQGPGMYGGEGYAATGPWGSAYGQGGLGQQGYNYSYGSNPYGSNNWAYGQVYGYGGNCELIDQTYVTDSHTSGAEDGRTIQTVEFEIRPALNYRKMMCQYMDQLPFRTVFNIRAMASQSFFRVFVPASANVRYYNPFGGASNKYFQVDLRDLWGIGDTVDECMHNAGASTMPLERMLKCKDKGTRAEVDAVVNKNALDLTQKGYQNGIVPQLLFEGDIFTYTAEPDVINIPPAGSQDGIVEIMPTTIKKDGVNVSFKPIKTNCLPPYQGGNWTIRMTVDRSQMDDTVGCVNIEGQIRAKVARPMVWNNPRDAIMPVKFTVLNKNITDLADVDLSKCGDQGPAIIPVTRCQGGGYTGNAYTTYGFDRLPFDWQWTGIDKQQCDEESNGGKKSFCDAVQFSIELNKKAADQKAFAESLKFKLQDNEDNVKAAVLAGDVDEYKDSKNMYRWVYKQVKVNDKFNEPYPLFYLDRDFVFFVGSNGKILEDKTVEFSDSVKAKASQIKGVEVSNDPKLIVEKMGELLQELETEDHKEAIVIEVTRWNGITEEDKFTLSGFGLEEGEDYWALNEFKLFHEAIDAAIKDLDEPMRAVATGVNVKYPMKLENEKIDDRITVDFLKNLYSSMSFRVGTLHKKDMEEEKIAYVVENAKQITGLTFPNGYDNSFAKLYEKAIEFKSFLVKDGYSKELREHFEKKYSQAEANDYGEKWSFSLKEVKKDSLVLPEAGLYKVTLNYKFAEKVWEADFSLDKELSKVNPRYAENYFFSLPFDGEVGLESTDSRQGYGIGYSSGQEIALTYDSAYGNEGWTKLKQTSGGLFQYTLNYGDKFKETNTGTIFKAVSGTIEYNPSALASFKISNLSKKQGAGTEGVIYDIILGNLSLREIDSAYNTLNWFTWASDGKSFVDQPFSIQQARALCSGIGVSNYHGFTKEIENATTFNGIAYVPFREQYNLRMMCNQGDIESMGALTATTSRIPAGAITDPKSTIRNISLNSTDKKVWGVLKKYIDRINDEEVCITPSESSVQLYWNTQKLLGVPA